ncbi:hypothetical protein [Streptomyces sp. NPDC060198]|uniref:hypothetical protein n=1 Tax=Streptomyces sp. NPDC060198 TaxID=3347070 RepID=UPI00365E5A2A
MSRLATRNLVICKPLRAVPQCRSQIYRWILVAGVGLVAKGVLVVGLRVEAVRWVDDAFPGWIEVQFSDARGKHWSLVDKAPAFGTAEELGPCSDYPLAVSVACVMAETATADLEDDAIVTVSTSVHGITASTGEDEFSVRRSQLVP